MTTYATIDMVTTPDRFDEFRDFLAKHLPSTRTFPGNISVEVARNQEEPDRVLLVEKWRSRADFDAYLAWRQESGVLAELAAFADGEVRFGFHDQIGV
ncbi:MULTISPECIES: putative quinol monooxygenase [unclassified Nocardia]|uniref:putative quinol monooxygenase n=1 Tax=unclassified Nocardia TaxID=2637762 RepID=UPI00278C1D5D|nr:MULTISPECIES: antibiotic biosynthesis monooxygenase family protein [unclassified Nocardia]